MLISSQNCTLGFFWSHGHGDLHLQCGQGWTVCVSGLQVYGRGLSVGSPAAMGWGKQHSQDLPAKTHRHTHTHTISGNKSGKSGEDTEKHNH